MLLFRSEEHVDRWCAAWQQPRGAVLSLEQCWQLADAWYRDRMSPTWRCRTPEALALLKAEPSAQQVESRVFISIPGTSGDSVLNSTAELQLDAAGRIVGMAIHPF